MKKQDKYFDVIYKTKGGRLMVAKRVAAKTEKLAKSKLKLQMKESKTFDKVVMANEI